MCEKIMARANFHGHQLKDVPVINPGDWFGKSWLLEIGGSYSPLFLIIEANSAGDAIDELADNETYGHLIVVADEDLADYDPDDCHYGPSGQILDLDHLMIHGEEGSECPFRCLYFSDELPDMGIEPLDFQHWEDRCDTR